MNSLDSWRDQLRGDPARTVAGVLEGWLDRGPWQRAEPADFLLDLTDADEALSELAATALLDWTREKLTWDDRRRLRYGERAHAGQLADALATLQRLKAPRADYQLAEQHPWFEARVRPLRFDERMDLPRLLWLATAFVQPDERFLPRWLEICGQAARLAPGWCEWLRVGLTGLRKLPAQALPAEQQALAGLLVFEHRIKRPSPQLQEATEFSARQFELLKELFHRGPRHWPTVLAEVRERTQAQGTLPAWVPGTSGQTKPKGKSVGPPTRQDVQRMAGRLRGEPVAEALWQSLHDLFSRYLGHAQHTGESEFLVKTVGNLGNILIKRQPTPDILRNLLAWIRTALDWDAGDAYLWPRLADCYQALGQMTAAEDTLWEAIRRFPDNDVCRTILAELLRDKGATDEAESLLRETKKRFPEDAHCRTILAELLRDKGETDEAESLLRETMIDFPDNAHCRTILAELLRDKGETDEAETLLRETMIDFPDDAHCRTILAELLRDKGETDEAETLLRETREKFPADAISRHLLDRLLQPRMDVANTNALVPETNLIKAVSETERESGELRIPQFGQRRRISTSSVKLIDHSESSQDDDPFISWAAERAPIIRWVHDIGRPNDIDDALIKAARNGGAAELAEAALRLLFPEDALPVEEALRARPASLVLRLFQSERNAKLGLDLIDTAPEAESVLRDLYRANADPATWDVRFRDAVLACADLTSPPAWRHVLM